ncbi:hypothetical protein DFH09DRAFT_1449668 [Mycena vulgaris]|nr:hypothetical protein DFH09DRAFT_1449668 [Mycena vulgaris]
MNLESDSTHSFNFRLFSDSQDPSLHRSHRRHNSEPLVITALPGAQRKFTNLSSLVEEQRTRSGYDDTAFGSSPDRLAPAPTIRLRPQYSIRRPRPNTEILGLGCTPEIVLGEPKEHIGHPKTRIGQPALKLAAIKERMEHLEATNEQLQHRIESYRTDAEMLSSSVTYFSSEYYAGLLAIRELRARTRQDAEVMSEQEQQLCQLKKFVGLMVEIGLHTPVLERAHASVLVGKDFEPVLVEAIRIAAARHGSVWAGVVATVNAPPGYAQALATTDAPDVFERRQSTVDDLLKSLENGDIPSGRHRSATLRFRSPVNKAPLRSTPPKNSLRVRSPKAPGVSLSPSPPMRSVLGKLDVNRSPQLAEGTSIGHRQLSVRSNNLATHKKLSPGGLSPTPKEVRRSHKSPSSKVWAPKSTGGDTPLSTARALASLQRILDNFSSGSIGSLGTTTDGSQSQSTDCNRSASPVHATPIRSSAGKSPSQSIDRDSSTTQMHALHAPPTIRGPAAKKSLPRLCIRPPTACSATTKTKTASSEATRRAKHLTGVPSPAKKMELGSPGERGRRTSDSGTPASWGRKGGWR